MKAAQISDYGDTSVLSVNHIDKPPLRDGSVLVEVHAASLNPFDTKLRQGYMKDMIPLTFPMTVGGDIAGVVVELGAGVKDLSVGDKVYGQAMAIAGASGAVAEFADAKRTQIAVAPQNLDFKEAASLPLVGVSALQAITDHLQLEAGQKLFINGAGGIGQIAIQIAKHIGAYIAVTTTGKDIQTAAQLGADEVIDYKNEDFTTKLQGYDAVFDTVGVEDPGRLLSVLKDGGKVVSMVGSANEAEAQKRGITAINQSTKVTDTVLTELRVLVESDVVKPNVGPVFPIDQIKEAFEARESGAVRGKVVIAIK